MTLSNAYAPWDREVARSKFCRPDHHSREDLCPGGRRALVLEFPALFTPRASLNHSDLEQGILARLSHPATDCPLPGVYRAGTHSPDHRRQDTLIFP